ncbi:GLPGLI family protein [Cellulophaga baltica]|uniref:GLPGLI family protein n=1 Tax=Cellulophaga baltica TaxID=76594 RepID=UPI00249523D5|nr:GLPGLI family protein [Cellulophaga baltica]
MKKVKYLILFFIVFESIAQNTYSSKITYRANYNLDSPYSNITELIFNKSSSFFYVGDDIIGEDDREIKVITYENDFHEILYTDLVNNLIFDKLELLDEVVLVKEEITKIPWQIDYESSETILGYPCFKAETLFRGRYYTAWFTEEIPVKFGPWKLNGLPGLILEVHDKYHEVEFNVEKIENFKDAILIKDNFSDNKSDYTILELHDYVNKIDEHIKYKVDLLISKLPRESKAVDVKTYKYKGVELDYEWEAKSNKD